MSARTRFFAGPIRGRTHRSAPTRRGRYSGNKEIGAKTNLSSGAGRSPPPTGWTGGVRGGVRSPRPTEAPQVVPSNGPMWASAPTKDGKVPSTTRASGAQRSVRACGREGWAGIDAKTIPKGGPPPRPPGQRLAKRKARKEELVKFSLCPIPSECSTAYRVRNSHESPARAPADITSTEQNGLGPRPAAREGAPRP